MKIKKGDTVVVITGKDRGKKSTIEKVLPSESKVMVRGINIVKRHQKSRGQNRPGGIIEKTLSIDVSNVMYWCKKCENRVRLGYEIRGKEKIRVCKKCEAVT